MYLITEDSFDTSMSLRISEPNRKDRSMRWASDYEFDKRWPPSDSLERGDWSDPSTVGRVVEAFVTEGIAVATVVGDESLDLIAEISGQTYVRVQVKPGWKVGGRIQFNPTGADDIDYVAVYNRETENTYTISTSQSLSGSTNQNKPRLASIGPKTMNFQVTGPSAPRMPLWYSGPGG